MTFARLGALTAALAAVLSGCATPTGGGGELAASDIATPGPTASVTGLRTPQASLDRIAAQALIRRNETLAAKITRRTALRASPGGKVLFHVTPETVFRSPRAMAVMRRHGDWVGVAAEDLANGVLAWVRKDDVFLQRVTWKIRVDLSQRRGWLLHRGKVYRSFSLGVGTPTYKTPTGHFGVTDRLRGESGGAYGCCALALTAHQPNVPQDWPGGDHIALHGTPDPSSIGQESTHGCLRASEDTMLTLMAKVPIGTPVVIRK